MLTSLAMADGAPVPLLRFSNIDATCVLRTETKFQLAAGDPSSSKSACWLGFLSQLLAHFGHPQLRCAHRRIPSTPVAAVAAHVCSSRSAWAARPTKSQRGHAP